MMIKTRNTTEIIGTFYGEKHVFQDGTPSRTIIGSFETHEKNRRPITIKGEASPDDFRYGGTYRLDGFWSEHPKYGVQFHFTSFCQPEPQDRSSIVDYIATCPGIGKMRAAKIFDLFGMESLSKIKMEPLVLKQIRGVTEEMANDVQKSLLERESHEQFTMELKKILAGRGFPKSLFRHLKNDHGTAAVEEIRKNPYLLLKYKGTGFERVDQLFIELGNSKTDMRRQKHLIEWLIETDRTGSTWISKSSLKAELVQSLQDFAKFDEAVELGIASNLFVEKDEYLATPSAAKAENDVANWLHHAQGRAVLWPEVLQTTPENQPSEHQWNEYKKATSGPIALLTGSPGTGKTWLVARIIETLQKTDATISVAAPTGKAALRITETLKGQNVAASATTIHSLLGAEADQSGWKFRYNGQNKLVSTFLIIDESSMIDTKLLSSLLEAIDEKTNILFVGDPDQLAPVGCGAPLRDMIEFGFPCGKLTEIRRNAGAIVHACAAIREQRRFDTHTTNMSDTETNLVLMKSQPQIESIFSTLQNIEQFEKQNDTKFTPTIDMQIIVAVNERSALSKKALNELLQNHYNAIHSNVLTSKVREFRPGDKIICTKNGNAMLAKTTNHEIKIANGDIGFVEDIEKSRLLVDVNDEWIYVPTYSEQWGESDWDLGYAISCHKSQGSQWPVIVVILDPSFAANGICDRHWIYTAISRAQRRCYLLGNETTVWEMIKKSTMKNRKTLFVEQLNHWKWAFLNDKFAIFLEQQNSQTDDEFSISRISSTKNDH